MIGAHTLAVVLKGGITDSSPSNAIGTFYVIARTAAQELKIDYLIDTGLTDAQAGNVIRSAVVGRLNRGVEVAAIGASRGYILPDNPIPRFNQINANRQLFAPLTIPENEQLQLAQAATDLVELANAYDAGTVTFDRPSAAAQLAAFEVSVDGMSPQSGDALVDILGYQPDADYIKRKRALDSLAKLDFSKRKTYLLFTADVITGGKRRDGTIVCWMKMRDASGYSIAKRNVFEMFDYPKANFTNATLEQSTTELLKDNNFSQILSFYDWVQPDDIYAFVDDATEPDSLYSYSVTGIQQRIPSSPFMFDVPNTSLYLTAAQSDQVLSAIRTELSRFTNSVETDSTSPYPALAQVIYGDSGYGWIIAGCNVTAALRRGESNEQVRSMSYIGSSATDIIAAAAQGRIVLPNDIAKIHESVERSISSYGVSQTLLSILDGTGATMFASGKDDLAGFQPTQQVLERTGGGLAKILATIDPQTASIDPKTLTAALGTRTTRTSGPRYQPISMVADGSQDGPTAMIISPPPIEAIVGDDPIDLTTYDGISRLMQVLRIIYDFYPGGLS